MYSIEIFLPLRDNANQPFNHALFEKTRQELTQQFDGLTAYSRAPAEGTWKPSEGPSQKDEIVIYEIMTDTLDKPWWAEYRRRLEGRFHQESIVIRAIEMERL